MSTVVSRSTADDAAESSVHPRASARSQRVTFLLVVAAAVAVGFLATRTHAAVDAAGEDLTRLLRGMALLKALMASFVIGGVVWRLGVPASRLRLAFYTATCGVMALGPGLIWGMEHVRAGALFLHAGLAIAVIALWRDPAVGARLAVALRSRRAR